MYNIISEANVFVFGFEGLALNNIMLKRWGGGWAHVSLGDLAQPVLLSINCC